VYRTGNPKLVKKAFSFKYTA
jgi:hypothetical protein